MTKQEYTIHNASPTKNFNKINQKVTSSNSETSEHKQSETGGDKKK